MPRVNDVRKGQVINEDGQLWTVVDIDHVKPGKGPAYYQIKRKNLNDGRVVANRYTSGSSVELAFLETRTLQYGWEEGDAFIFMDAETFEQYRLVADLVGDLMPYVKPNEMLTVKFFEDKPVTFDLPSIVELEVVDTEPAVKGDTVTNVFKPATLETGLEIKVPLFIAPGETVKVQTASGEFGGRANK